jgi:hypothetical protein
MAEVGLSIAGTYSVSELKKPRIELFPMPPDGHQETRGPYSNAAPIGMLRSV